MDFNKGLHRLGQLCLRGHDYNKTGKSIRYKTSRSCVVCALGNEQKRLDQDAYNKAYRKKHKKQINARSKAWYQKNKQRKIELGNNLRAIPENIERRNKQAALDRLFLSDGYMSALIYKTQKVWITDPDIIKAKRNQVLLTRLIKIAEKEAASGHDSYRDK
jgi:hypothetical protein